MKINFMLIDDSKVDVFINQKQIEKLAVETDVRTFFSASHAIDYLDKIKNITELDDVFVPDIILLDINMPTMNGFEFLKSFMVLNEDKRFSTKIYMLSSSTNLIDIQNAKKKSACHGYIIKPLTSFNLENIVFNFKPFLYTYDFLEENISPPHFFNE